ncbi:NADH:flavin oxidoreductase/NADH oxidase [Vineibacter terrae]|uniref:NADH:flavin oxidoreductase/NADH oxidase n=1 Tax=Vineibacter terrae TaxID=2586908 RepID=UPI002E35CCF5|nr:NADH:flavin oxidoreductase/NADH oxidase [Vineibacter terrae]HEX2884937.1 NADH:flavin oxidoreductase/NADH oxidase [Vineibacter terrae]
MPPTLFSALPLGGDVVLPNRIVVSPMCQYVAVDGSASDWHLVHLGQLAASGAGLLMVEATHVEARGRITQGCLGLYSDANEAALQRVVDWVRAWAPATKLGIQIGHAGRKGSAQRPWKGGGPLGATDAPDTPWTCVAPSAIAFDATGPGVGFVTGGASVPAPTAKWHTPVALDRAGLDAIKQAFVAATTRAARLGFDVLELHGAHGYLLHQFLSPLSNRRDDDYGGTADKRRRFPLEVFEACRAVWPRERALGVRLSAIDWVEGGVTIEDTIATAMALKALGCDFIDVSSGGAVPTAKIAFGPGYQVPFAARVRQEAGIKTWAVGIITEPQQAEQIVASGQADCTALARSFLADPRWGWNAARTLGAQLPPLPTPYHRAGTILQFKPQPAAKAAE